MSGTLPIIAINGSTSHGGGASPINAPATIAGDYAQLIAAGADAFQSSGAKVFDMDAGTLSLASPAQIGRITQGITVTAGMVQQNQMPSGRTAASTASRFMSRPCSPTMRLTTGRISGCSLP
jgi:hypothetical protein